MLIEIGSQQLQPEVRPARTGVAVPPSPWSVRDFVPLRTTLRPLGCAWYPPCKRAAEVAAALVLLALAAPVIALAALLVKLSSRGPAFYSQTRVGRNGRLFSIYKIRTMVHNCESLTGPRWSIPGDPRVTRLGAVLRTTHLDELPQLLNVLRGDMSLVGPRPERPEFVPQLQRELPLYRERLAVRPGVTGLAQVRLAADTDLDSVRRKLAYDLYYIRHLSPWLELRILAGTFFYTFGDPWKLSHKLRLVPADEVIRRDAEELLPDGGLARGKSVAA